ncbi:MAG: chloride channel protein [Thermoanaerobaculia bacterium]|nr:chloride channel protein [Thermoanaerobaculia bacterium]
MALSLEVLGRRLGAWRRSAEFALAKKFGVATVEDRAFLLLVGATGVIAGVLGVVLHRLINAIEYLLWGPVGHLVDAAKDLPPWHVVLALAIGGILVGSLVLAAGKAVAAPGMSILIEAVARKGGRVPVKPILWSTAAAAATVGAGGSLGREGPMIRLGAMIASRLGVRYRLSPHRIKILVGCGAAAGLAAAYNIPIGGALFAMEVILGNFALPILGPIVVSSAISTLIARAFEGDRHRFAAPGYELASGWELIFYVGLGVLAALVSIAFVLGVRRTAAGLRRIPCPEPLRPVLGMALLGVMALQVPWVLGGGQETTNLLLLGWLADDVGQGRGPWLTAFLLLGLAVAKILATGLTTGAGGVGGLFAPSLFVGALAGAAYGMGVHALFPGATAGYGAYAAVGMAAIAAGTSHAPISAILILFEFTGNYDLILPLMVAAITSTSIARRLYPYSIYTEPLRGKGIDLSRRMEDSIVSALKVSDLVHDDPDTLRPELAFRDVAEKFFGAPRSRLFVVDGDGRLEGVVSLHDIKHVLDEPTAMEAVTARDLATSPEPVLRGDDSLQRASAAFAEHPFERLAVVDRDDRFRGFVAKRDLLAIYAQEFVGRPALLANFVSADGERLGRRVVELPPSFAIRIVELPAELAGRTLAEARLPQDLGLRVLEIERSGAPGPDRFVPRADTVLLPGDQLVLLGPTESLERLAGDGWAAAAEAP